MGFLSHGFILCGFHLTPLYPVWVSSPMVLSYMGLLSHRFILCGFPLPGLYPMWVSLHTALSYRGFISLGFILCGLSLMALSYVGFIPMSLSYECFIPRALSLWVLSPKAFILCGCHPIQQGYISMWSFPFLHNNFGTLISEELTSTKRLQVKQTERQSNSKCG